jgi:hypothetical protein
MSLAEVVYSARFRSTETIERGRTQVLSCPTMRAGATATPSIGTFTLYRPDRTQLVAPSAVTIAGGIATFSLAGGVTTAEILSEGYLVEWALTMPDGIVHTFRNDAAVCRRTLYPVISDTDLLQRHSDLTALLGGASSYQSYIDEAFFTIANRLIAQGRRPCLVIQPSALREAHLMLTLHLIFLDFQTSAGDSGRWQALASYYGTAYEAAWGQIRFVYDEADENVVDVTKKKSATSVVWTGGRGDSLVAWWR